MDVTFENVPITLEDLLRVTKLGLELEERIGSYRTEPLIYRLIDAIAEGSISITAEGTLVINEERTENYKRTIEEGGARVKQYEDTVSGELADYMWDRLRAIREVHYSRGYEAPLYIGLGIREAAEALADKVLAQRNLAEAERLTLAVREHELSAEENDRLITLNFMRSRLEMRLCGIYSALGMRKEAEDFAARIDYCGTCPMMVPDMTYEIKHVGRFVEAVRDRAA